MSSWYEVAGDEKLDSSVPVLLTQITSMPSSTESLRASQARATASSSAFVG
ncbi:hypothetical protein [Parafrankia sp. EUN1f]|uniref:hypothetical protein n=1 Tax=Parafrankia sp. EUN1f TaxID=102897 RepID=UPI0001C4747F|nr:hypothetical protein [Parafrankia sp. EUN1f]EFC79993.1 hypothetical protein FrEUN1fDRAFT_6887 [Parafrankia sp. EUN1f]